MPPEELIKLQQAKELLQARNQNAGFLLQALKNLGYPAMFKDRFTYYDTAQQRGISDAAEIGKILFPDVELGKKVEEAPKQVIPKVDVQAVKQQVQNEAPKFIPKKLNIQQLNAPVEENDRDKKQEKILNDGAVEMNKIAKGLIESPFNVLAIEQLKQRISEWMKAYAKLPSFSLKWLKSQSDTLKNILDTQVPKMLQGAQIFETRMQEDAFDLDSIDAPTLVAGLKAFYPAADANQGATYLQTLKNLAKKPTSLAEAACSLFSNDKEGLKSAESFLLTKKIVINYPANQLGTYYRGDNRAPKEIPNGFTAYKVLTVQEAKDQAQKWFGEGLGPIAYHQDWISKKSGGDKIATGNDIGCMGYGCAGASGANRNVYMITVPNLQVMAMTEENLGVKPHSDKGPKLIINASKLADATIIGVQGKDADETTFFTSLTNIKLIYRNKGDNEDDPKGWVWD